MFAIVIIKNMSSASGGSAPGPRWWTSVPQTSWFPQSIISIPATVDQQTLRQFHAIKLAAHGGVSQLASKLRHYQPMYILFEKIRLYFQGTACLGMGGSVAEWLACWTQVQKVRVQIAVATLSGNSLRKLLTPIVRLFTKQRNW